MWAERSRKRLWRNRLLDVMLWQICPQGLAKANTEDNSWLLNSEGNLAGIFVEGKETDFALLLQVRRRKTFRIKKDQKNHSKKVDNCPKTGCSQARNLEIKTDWNRPFTNYKPWPFELFEMTIYCLRGPLSWGDKSGRHSKNHGSLAGGISISCGLHRSWWLRHQISLNCYTIPPVMQARLSFAIVLWSWTRSFAPLCLPSCKWHICCSAGGKTCYRLASDLVGEWWYSQMPHAAEFRNISIRVGPIAHVHLQLVPGTLSTCNHTAASSNLRDQLIASLHLAAFYTVCLEIWIWRKQLKRREAHTSVETYMYKRFPSMTVGSTVQVRILYLWPFPFIC